MPAFFLPSRIRHSICFPPISCSFFFSGLKDSIREDGDKEANHDFVEAKSDPSSGLLIGFSYDGNVNKTFDFSNTTKSKGKKAYQRTNLFFFLKFSFVNLKPACSFNFRTVTAPPRPDAPIVLLSLPLCLQGFSSLLSLSAWKAFPRFTTCRMFVRISCGETVDWLIH